MTGHAADPVESVDFVVAGLGALGSATAMTLAGRGHSVVGLERFDLGHARGASHDSSRILRHSYHTPAYVRLTQQAYADWAQLESESGESLVTIVGGLDLFPPQPAISPAEYLESLAAVGIAHEVLDGTEVARRWHQFRLPDDVMAIYQPDGAIVPAARGTATMQSLARRRGAALRERSPVVGVAATAHGVEVATPHGRLRARSLVVCADAWVNDIVGPLGVQVPVEVTLEQVTYFQLPAAGEFACGRIPLWIWMDDPSYYAFPCYGEPTVKAAQDCGGPLVDPEQRTSQVDRDMERRLSEHMHRITPGVGRPVRSVRCQYTLTPDRDFVVSAVPDLPQVVVGLGAAHAFKFSPTLGRLLADLAADGATSTDVSDYRLERPALTNPGYRAHWLV